MEALQCAVCAQAGLLAKCARCCKSFHPKCAGETARNGEKGEWTCKDCWELRAQAVAETSGCEITANDLARVPLGRSLSNTLPKTKKSASRVNGPCSALSSFLAERGIVAPSRNQRRASAEAGPAEEPTPLPPSGRGAAAAAAAAETEVKGVDVEDDDFAIPAAAASAPHQAKRARFRNREAAAEALLDGLDGPSAVSRRRSQPAAEESDDDDDADDDATTTAKRSKKESAKKKPNDRKGAKKGAKDDNDDDDDDGRGALDPYKPRRQVTAAQCGTCSVRIAPGMLLCPKCQRSGSRAPSRRTKTMPSARLAALRGKMLPLRELCIRVVSENIDGVESFGDVPAEVLDRIGRLVCQQRRLRPATLPPFLRSDLEALELTDCADLKCDSFSLIAARCPLLQTLILRNCGQLEGPALAQLGRMCAGLQVVELDGCFRVSDDEMASFVRSARPLSRFALHNSMKVGAVTAAAIASRADALTHLRLLRCTFLTDDGLHALGTLPQLREVVLDGSELLSDASIVNFLQHNGAQLHMLHLRGLRQLTDDTASAIAKYCHALTDVALSGLDAMTGPAIAAIWAHNAHVQKLDLARCTQIDDKALAAVTHQLPRLHSLSLHGLPRLTPDGIVAALRHCPELEELDTSWCRDVDDNIIGDVVKHSPRMGKVTVWGCMRVTDMLAPALPAVTVVGCSRI